MTGYVPVLTQLLAELDGASTLSPEMRSRLPMAKIALRVVQDTLSAIVRERKETEERAARALAALRPSDLINLPEPLREQLQLSPNDHLDLKIFAALEGLGGSATLEKLLIEMWKSHKTMLSRRPLARRLHGLVERGVIFRTPGRRGFYHTSHEAAIAGTTAPATNPNSQRVRHVG